MPGRRREAVLLGAWFLMAPPVPDGQRLPDVHAPLSSWTRVRSFDTAMRGEDARFGSGAAARAMKDSAAEDLAERSRCFHSDRLRAMGALLAGAGPASRFRAEPT